MIWILILIVFITAVVCYLYLTDFGRRDFFPGHRKPKLQIPVTYTIAWWTNQESLIIDAFNIEIVESKLNVYISKSLISYKISGKLFHKGTWQSKIGQVHISERLNHDMHSDCDRIIEITPIVKVAEHKNVNGGTEKFEFTNEFTIASNQWGPNRIKFVCSGQEQIIELLQSK